jgi:hypothetical protein
MTFPTGSLGEREMNRRLRVSRRPFVVFAIVLSPVVLIWLLVLVKKGFRSDLILPAILPFLLYAAIMMLICSRRVTVSRDGITVCSYFVLKSFIPFAAIDHSAVQIFAERDHPAWVTVYYMHGKKRRRLSMSLKPYRKEDVAWLCALPEIKAETHAGFTKRS